MPLSKKKQEKATLAKRREIINKRSLDGKGYFMDANWESYARQFLETGDENLLAHIPDFSDRRK